MDSLKSYREKRDFKVTSEPSGKAAKSGRTKKTKAPDLAGGRFVIHKHDATRLHYDLRLEHDGVLWSWAITRGPSLDPSEKRLAVHVEDHPLDYRTFEGVIPKGQYGAGAVIIWDDGTWQPAFDAAWGLEKGHLRFTLKGSKLNGEWHLVRLKPRGREKTENWLFFKTDDEFALTAGDILEAAPLSVASGRSIEDVRAGKPARKAPQKTKAEKTTNKRRKPKLELAFVEPCLASLQSMPPDGDDWVHEIKFDGYRLQALVSGGEVRLLTRTGLDWTVKFGPEIPAALAALDLDSAIIDGEVIVLGDDGLANFSELQLALSEGRSEKMLFYAFDLLHLDGNDLRDQPLMQRKGRLEALVPQSANGAVQFSQHFTEPGRTMLSHICRMGLEGIISKRASRPYSSGRSADWIKTKCTLRQEFAIAGYIPSEKTGRGLRSLAVGFWEGRDLHSAGRVGTGFSGPVADDLLRRLKPLETKRSAYKGEAGRERGVVWVKPQLVAEVEFRSWTRDRHIRHASFQGLREDKPSSEVAMEEPQDEETAEQHPTRKKPAPKKLTSSKAGADAVTLTSPDKELWPDDGITKRNLLDYYASVWPRMEQFVVNRPLSLVRAPDGIHGQRFFQKHASKGMHAAIRRMADPEDGEELLYIDNFDGLAALVQFGVVEIHIWGSRIEDIEHPDQIIFDLDPDEGLAFDDVRKAAFEVKDRLNELGLTSLVKVTGGKGLHVVLPLRPKADWVQVKTFAHDFALAMAQASPQRYTATLSKKARVGRIFIDYLRNGRGSTAVAPYSSRAKPGGTLALPITWDMAWKGAKPADFAIGGKTLAARLKAVDPWADFFALGKPLDPA